MIGAIASFLAIINAYIIASTLILMIITHFDDHYLLDDITSSVDMELGFVYGFRNS